MENQSRLPEYDELTQCVVEDGKGGYAVKPMSVAKEEPVEEPRQEHEQIMRPTEVRVTEVIQALKEENDLLKAELQEKVAGV